MFRGWRSFITTTLLMLSPMLLVAARFRGYLADDDVIAIRLGERLAAGAGMTLNDGEFVHGVTALLAVLLGGLAEMLGIPALALLRAHSVVATAAVGWALLWAADRSGVRRRHSVTLIACLLAGLPFALWSFTTVGGTVLAATITWVAALVCAPGEFSRRRRLGVAALLMLSLLVRIDAMAVVAPALVLLAFRRDRRLLLTRVHLPVLSFWAVSLLAQYLYFGSLVPEMASTKFSVAPALVRVGGLYLAEFLRAFAPTVAAVLLVLLSRDRTGRRGVTDPSALLPVVLAASWLAYVVWVGGDWMPGYRHFALVLTLLVLAVLLRAPSRRLLLAALPLIAAGSVLSLLQEPADRALDSRRWLENCVRGASMLGEVLAEQDPLMAVEPAGCPPKYTGFRIVDMLGLFDEHIAHTELQGRAVSWVEWQQRRNADPDARATDRFIPGHGKGDGAYVWKREPDLFVLCDPDNLTGEGCFRSWAEIRSEFELESRYRLLTFDIGNPEPWKAWVRWDGGRTGVAYRDGGALVPSWLLAPGQGAVMRRVEGALLPVLATGTHVDLPELALAAGAYEVELPSGTGLESLAPCASLEGGTVVVAADCEIRLQLRNDSDGSVVLRPLEFLSR